MYTFHRSKIRLRIFDLLALGQNQRGYLPTGYGFGELGTGPVSNCPPPIGS